MNAARSPRAPRLGGGRVGDVSDKGGEVSSAAAALASDLDMYSEIPQFELDVDEFEELALARLKVLRKIEELKSRNITGENYRAALEKTIKANLVADPSTLSASSTTSSSALSRERKASELRAKSRRIDVASHFILRAAYCRSEDLRRWFLAQECALFQYRLERVLLYSGSGGAAALRGFLKREGMDFDRVDEREKAKLRPYLTSIASIPSEGGGSGNNVSSQAEFVNEVYYRIPFTQALDLISTRRCYVRAGMAYVPLRRIVSIVRARFRSALSKSLVLASGAFGRVAAESDRVAPLLKSMNSQYTGKEYSPENASLADGGQLTAATVDDYVPHMPLCMSQLHAGLKRDHKIKHGARLQYYLFLKGAGLSMEESAAFFSREFTKIMTMEAWTKEYSYMIRHLYGKEGARKSKSPYNCMKIIMGNAPNAGEHHGCPYRHYDAANLSSLLTKLNIGTPGDRDVMLKHVKDRNYQLACVRHFEATHPGAVNTQGVQLDGLGNHPNAWFAASVSYASVKSGGTKKEGEGDDGKAGEEKTMEEAGGES